MQMQVEAERRKRATILESEGVREADINVAEGKRQSRILASGIHYCLTFIFLVFNLQYSCTIVKRPKEWNK